MWPRDMRCPGGIDVPRQASDEDRKTVIGLLVGTGGGGLRNLASALAFGLGEVQMSDT